MAKKEHQRGKSKGYRRSRAELAADRMRIAEMLFQSYSLRLQGKFTQSFIAETLGLSQATVSRDIDFLEQQWLQDAKTSIDQLKQEQLAHIRYLRGLYYAGYMRSREDRVKIQRKIDGLQTTGIDPETAAAEDVPWKQSKEGEKTEPLPYEELPKMSVSRTVEGRDGDVRWLQGVERQLLAERRVLGFDDTGKHPDTGNAQRIADAITGLPQTLIDDLNKRYGHPDDQVFE